MECDNGIVIKYPYLKFKNECLKLGIFDYYDNVNVSDNDDNDDNDEDNDEDNGDKTDSDSDS